jgi:hypothetical protein
MNSIKNHLCDLKPTYFDGKYQLAMPCETRKFLDGYYDMDMFQKQHLGTNHLLTAPFIASVVQHSVESVLIQAKKHDSMAQMFGAYRAEFILGVCCPETQKHHVYRYEILPNEAEGAVVFVEEIPQGRVAVIGMRMLHEEDANSAFAEAIAQGKRTAESMYEFLIAAIREQNSIGVLEIGMPAFMYHQRGIRLELKRRSD